jgi:hypothetical protein
VDLREHVDYAASPGEVFEMLCNELFRAKVCEATHALSHTVSAVRDGDRATVTVVRVLPADVPDAVRRLVGETLEVAQVERWGAPDSRGARTASVSVDVRGQPAGMLGHAALEPTASGSRQTVVGDVKVRIPILGRRIEPYIGEAVRSAMRKEAEIGGHWLAGRR